MESYRLRMEAKMKNIRDDNETQEAAKCGECLFNTQDIVALDGGICPKCGADYRNPLPFKKEGDR